MLVKEKTLLRILVALLSVVFFLSAGILGWYWYDNNVDRSGWVIEDNQYYYRNFHNKNVTGWQQIDSSRYYFDETGIMQTGWLSQEGSRYFLKTDGTMATGWLSQGNDRYYLNADGTMASGWQTIQGLRYYLGEDGKLQTGLTEIDGKLFYLDDDGVMRTGMHSLDGKTYYFTDEGPAATGSLQMEDLLYFFADDGVMQTGWVEQEDGKHYYLPEGPMAYGFQEIEGRIYYLDPETGIPHTGWFTEGEYSYYFGEDGAALTGPQEIDGRKFYFTPKGIYVMLVNASNPIPDYYDPDLVTLTGWHRLSSICLEPMKKMLADCKAAGNNVQINSIYRSGENQKMIMEERTKEYMAAGMTYEEAFAKVNLIVAPPGTSEHETGLSADLVGEDAKKWLGVHCWEYGFILRYPPEKADITGITFEPWHFRYVGEKVSMDMKDSGLCLEEYLGAGPAK